MKIVGSIVAGALAGMLTAGVAMAEEGKGGAAAAGGEGKCQHNCKGHAACKGNGSETCKGHNSCGGQGQNNPKCAAAKDQKACEAVKDKGKEMCEWKA